MNVHVFETDEELRTLQSLLDESYEHAGSHLKDIITVNRRLSAEQLCERLQGMCLLVVATSTKDGRPLVGPVDSYFLHGSFHFSSGRQSVKMRHLAVRPHASAVYLPGEELSVTVHGDVELFDVLDAEHADLRDAMLDHYKPTQGSEFEKWLVDEDPLGALINASKIFTFHMA